MAYFITSSFFISLRIKRETFVIIIRLVVEMFCLVVEVNCCIIIETLSSDYKAHRY